MIAPIDKVLDALASTLGPVAGWEQIEPREFTETERARIEAMDNLIAAWTEVDKVQEMIDSVECFGERPHGLMMNALSRAADAQERYNAAWEADNKARAEKLGQTEEPA